MYFVEYDPGVFIQAGRFVQYFVAEYFGSHDQHRRLGVDGNVPGEYPDVVPELALEIPEFLVGKRLDRRGVDYPQVVADGVAYDVFGNRSFPRPRGSRDDYRNAPGLYSL